MRRPLVCLLIGLALFILAGWAAGELWTSIVGSSDLGTVRELESVRSDALTNLARVVTWAGSAFLLVPLALACALVLTRAGLHRAAAAVLLSLGGAILISNLVKLLVSRPRPAVEHLQAVTGSSFPSTHATQAGAFWFSIVLALRGAGIEQRLIRLAAAVAALIVLGVLFSRVYLGVHYPSDVIAGLLLGTGWAVLVWRCIGGQASGPPPAHAS